jgi:putative toxin-antitoxin system antitoxin component (TIGR02293 family)
VTYDRETMTEKTDQESLYNNILSEPITAYGSPLNGSTLDLIDWARRGVTMGFLTKLGEKLSFSLNEIGHIIHVSLRTLQRYDAYKTLDTDASAKAIQLAALRKHGLEVFEDEQAFNEWLKSSLPALEGERPIDYLDTSYGFDLINQILGRIDHGVFA